MQEVRNDAQQAEPTSEYDELIFGLREYLAIEHADVKCALLSAAGRYRTGIVEAGRS